MATDLFGEMDDAAKKKAKRKPREVRPDSPCQRVLAAFRKAYIARWAVNPHIVYGRDAKQAKGLIDSWGEQAVLDTVQQFFETTDPKVEHAWNADYLFPHFMRVAQYLYLRRTNGPATDRRTAENVDTITRALDDDPPPRRLR